MRKATSLRTNRRKYKNKTAKKRKRELPKFRTGYNIVSRGFLTGHNSLASSRLPKSDYANAGFRRRKLDFARVQFRRIVKFEKWRKSRKFPPHPRAKFNIYNEGKVYYVNARVSI